MALPVPVPWQKFACGHCCPRTPGAQELHVLCVAAPEYNSGWAKCNWECAKYNCGHAGKEMMCTYPANFDTRSRKGAES